MKSASLCVAGIHHTHPTHTNTSTRPYMCRSPLRERVLLPDYTPVFYGVLGFAPGHFRCKNDSRYRSWRPNSHRHHRSLQVSSLAQDLQCPLRPLLYDWHSPNPSPAFEFPWLQELHTHTHTPSEEGVVAYKHNDYEAYGHGAGSQNISLKALRRGSHYAQKPYYNTISGILAARNTSQ